MWANGFEWELIVGVDGNIYPAYKASTIEQTQLLLARRGLYHGPANGILDQPTMEAICILQEAAIGMQVSGIPTPRTRMLLEQGSHTF